jgi:phosphatidylserine decarboxylase
MRIAREGYPLIFTAALLSLLAFAAGWLPLGVILGLAALAITAFFRDPERHPPEGEGLIVAPADGKVVSVTEVKKDESRFLGAVIRVSIFLSPLDVHINRSPVDGKVEEVRYQRGKFLAAYKDQSSTGNEQNSLRFVDPKGKRLGVVQVAGVVARRIVCWVNEGDHLSRGARIGLIMFGSRTDTYLPEGCRVEVVEGQRVKGGESILARFV